MTKKNLFFISLIAISSFFLGCGKSLFTSIPQQKQMGMKVRDEILSKPTEYPVLDEKTHPQAYAYLRKITNNVLNSGKLAHRNDFDWEVRIINDDKTLNAFCTPGGYIFVYTGLIKYLDNEDQLAGVMGHEMGHADKEHSARTMEKQMGLGIVAQLAGAVVPEQLSQLTTTFLGLKYSRDYEKEADAASVDYLSTTKYQCNGAAGFFVKLEAAGGGRQPEFLSTHPAPENRIKNINAKAETMKCTTKAATVTEYQAFKKMFPGSVK